MEQTYIEQFLFAENLGKQEVWELYESLFDECKDDASMLAELYLAVVQMEMYWRDKGQACNIYTYIRQNIMTYVDNLEEPLFSKEEEELFYQLTE